MTKSMDPTRRNILRAAAVSVPALVLSRPVFADDSAPIARCKQGKLKGVMENGVMVFKGVPYAGSVSGAENRFKRPPPPEPWSGVFDATKYGAPSIQAGQGFNFGQPDPSEDCLFLNIWTPANDGKKRPVMVYQHGGGFVVGSGNTPWQDGGMLAKEHDVVVVQSNHRLGVMGYLYLGELLGEEYQGNQGLEDLVAALKWVNENISAFGGDPDNVMLFGESGGGGKTASLYGMPSAAPYFSKASIESPIGPGSQTPAEATAVTRKVMQRLNITDPKALLSVPASQLLAAQQGDAKALPPGTVTENNGQSQIMFWPLIDGKVLPEEPFRNGAPAISAQKLLIIGTCKDETVFFYQGDKSVFNLDEAGLLARPRSPHCRSQGQTGHRAGVFLHSRL